MFETLSLAPPDAILGLTEAFHRDANPDKINLSVGVYQDAEGATPTLSCVQEAERRLLERPSSKAYLAIEGLPQYRAAVEELLFGAEHEIVAGGRAATVQTPGGTGALRVAADFIHKLLPMAHVWCSQPTWPNHANVFAAAGLQVEIYPYFDSTANGLAFDEMLAELQKAPPGQVVLLHACCHNPTGVDPTPQQWKQIADVVYDRRLLPLVDFAYQGFGDGLREDARGVLQLCRPGCELLICSSFSKNFGLYSERVGALTMVAASPQAAQAALSHAKTCARANYSNPPAHGAEVVAAVLGDRALRRGWEQELAQMRQRIHAMRKLFVETMQSKNAPRDFSFITAQRGMFSFSGLTPVQVDELRAKYSIYIVGNGRINVAGMSERNMDRLCEAVAAVCY